MQTCKFFGTTVMLGSLLLFAATTVSPSWAVLPNETGAAASPQAVNGTSLIFLNDTNKDELRKLLDAADDTDQNHKSRQSVLFFFGQPANIRSVDTELKKLATEYGDKLAVVVVDPANLSMADRMQRAWVEGDPSYPTAVFIGNGVLLPVRGAIAPANLVDLVTEGMNWDWNTNHKPDAQ